MANTTLVGCETYTEGMATKQDKLLNCAGTALPGGTRVPSCDEVADAIEAATLVFASGTNTSKTGTGTVADPIKYSVPASSTTVAGVTRFATNEGTRLGATDADKATTAVTPDDLSYTLQGNKAYNLTLKSPVTSGYAGIIGYQFQTDIGTWSSGTGYGLDANIFTPNSIASGAEFIILRAAAGSTTTNNGLLRGVASLLSSVGSGESRAVEGRAIGSNTGTNIGVYGHASGGAGSTNWAGYFDGNVAAGPITTLSDATLKENVTAIDPAKALQFRNGLRWVSYEMFTEQQEQITETVTDGEGNETQVPTGRYEVNRQSLGQKYGLIAQEIQALTESIGAFGDVVAVVGEYFTLDEKGYPVKGADGEPVVNKRFGLDYDAISTILLSAEQYDSSVSMRQARLALLQSGLLEKVQSAVDSADQATQIEWQFAQSVNRNYGLVTELAKKLGLTDKQLDELFALARTL